MDDYEVEEKKVAAGKILQNYSQFVMACIGEGVRPGQLRLHLMKELSGMRTSLDGHKGIVEKVDNGRRTSADNQQGASSSEASIRGP